MDYYCAYLINDDVIQDDKKALGKGGESCVGGVVHPVHLDK